MLRLFLLSALIALTVSFTSCKKDKIEQPEVNTMDYIIADNVVLINEPKTIILSSISKEELTFKVGDKDVDNIKVGDIIVSGITNKAPRGFLRKVLSIDKIGNDIILNTENAKLTDAIEQCSIRFTKKFKASDVVGKTKQFEIMAEIGEDSPLSAEVFLNPDFDFEIDIGKTGIEYAKFGFDWDYNAEVSLNLVPGISANPEKEIDLKPITILIGFVPIVITPDIELELGVIYQGPQYSLSYEASGSSSAHVIKDNSGWRTETDATNNTEISGISGKLESGLEAYLQAGIEFKLFDNDAFETEIFAKKSLNAELEISDDITCKMECEVSFGAELEIEFFGFEIEPVVTFGSFGPYEIYDCSEHLLTDEIEEFLAEEVFEEIENLYMPINTGFEPPIIEGAYKAAPLKVKNSNIPNDFINYFSSWTFEFANQDNDNSKIYMSYFGGLVSGEGLGYIVGEDNKFSVFTELDVITGRYNAKFAIVVSGKIVEEGIENLHLAYFMAENYGQEILLEIGQGRILYDSDGFSPRL